MSTTATPLFSWSVTATLVPAGLTATYSGSGSWRVSRPAASTTGSGAPASSTKETARADQAAGSSPGRSRIWRKPAGSCGRSPSSPPSGVTSSSRWFSIATTACEPSGVTAIESGWPPRSSDRTRSRVARSTTSRRPLGSVKLTDVSTTTRTYPPTIATDVGSSCSEPSSTRLSVPRPFGALGSVMSRKPMRRASASVWTTVRPSSLTVEISATVSAAASSPAGRFWNTGYVARRWNVSSAAGAVQAASVARPSAAVGADAAAPVGCAGAAASAGSAPRPRVSVAPVATSAARRVRRAGARTGVRAEVRSGMADMSLLRRGSSRGWCPAVA